jgi:hypothetical protein
VVPGCSAIFNDFIGNTYAYDSTTNVSTLLNLGSLPLPNITSSDIAHTQNKLWLYTNLYGTGTNIIEYNITLSPFTSVYNRIINLPVGYTLGAGMCAVNDTTLISSKAITNQPEQLVQITLNPDNTTSITNLFTLPVGRKVAGDILYTTDNKIILTTYTSPAPYYYYIAQYTLINNTWTLEFESDMSGGKITAAV